MLEICDYIYKQIHLKTQTCTYAVKHCTLIKSHAENLCKLRELYSSLSMQVTH